MAQSMQSDANKQLSSLLKVDDKGWNLSLFQNENKIADEICAHCKSVCCDAAELSCNHPDDAISLFCHDCLSLLIKNNNNKCIINSHTAPLITPSRAIRRKVLRSIIMCPYSTEYGMKMIEANKQNIGGNMINTMDHAYDEKEGIDAQQNNMHMSGCEWSGKLSEILSNSHLRQCAQKHDPTFLQQITIRTLENKNETLIKRIDELQNELTEKNKENAELKNKLNEQSVQVQKLMQQIQTINSSNIGQNDEQKDDGLCNQWNPNDKDSFIKLLNTETVTHLFDGWECHLLRAKYGYSEGIHRWDCKIKNFSAHYCNYLGVATKETQRVCHVSTPNRLFWGFRLHSFVTADSIINGKPTKQPNAPNSCCAGMVFSLQLNLEQSTISCYCDGKLAASLCGIPKDTLIYPAAYLGGHKNPMIFNTTFNLLPMN